MSPSSDPSDDGPAQRPYLAIVLAGMLGVAAFLALFFLTLGAVGPMLVIAACVFAVAALHYVVWGWWLGRLIHEDVEQEEQQRKS